MFENKDDDDELLVKHNGLKPVIIVWLYGDDSGLFPTICIFHVDEQYETEDIINLFSKGLDEARKQHADSALLFAGDFVCGLTGGSVHYLEADADFGEY